MQIKVCGMRNPENILALIDQVNPDWMGLIFYPKSPRYVLDSAAVELSSVAIKKVGVFVNEKEKNILRKIKEFDLSAIQLHGQESVALVETLRQKTNAEIWKVFSIQNQINWDELKGFLPFVDRFLFDTASASHGGSGQKFDWHVLKTYPFDKSFFLSGGLDEESLEEILELASEIPALGGVDLNSRFEDSPGLKNIEALKNFKTKLKRGK
jgi:phosphoribosylanthranilate isomerase